MIYFISDLHLGLPDFQRSLQREKKIVKWLDFVKNDATDIYFLGDIFEFWFEWKNTIPKHFTRFFGKLAELSDNNIRLHFFTGNHDIWAFDYFEKEFSMKIYRKPTEIKIGLQKFFLAHGDGLGPKDKMYKFMKSFFVNKFLQWCALNLLHPEFIFKIAHKVSFKREALKKNPKFKNNEEWLIQYANKVEKHEHFDFYIFGHRHIPVEYELNEKSKVIMLGDWIKSFTYASYDGKNVELKKYEG